MKMKKLGTKAILTAFITLAAAGAVMAAVPEDGKILQPTNYLLQKNLPQDVQNVTQLQPSVLALDLPTVVDRAIRNNRSITIAEMKHKEASEYVGEVAAAKNPSLQYKFQGAKQKEKTKYVTIPNPMGPSLPPVTVPVTIDRGFQNAVDVVWPLWTGGQVENGIRAARAAREVAQLDVYKTEAEVKVKATKAYYQLIEALNLRDVADTAVSNLTQHVDNVKAHFKAGVVAKIDVLSSEVALANAEEKQIQAANGVALAMANLNNILSLPIETELAVDVKDLPHMHIDLTKDQAMAYAMEHRWELAQARYGVKAAKAQLAMAKGGNYPTVAVSAGMNWQDTDFPGFENEDWTVGGGVSWKLFDGGATNAKIAKQKAALRAAEETLAQAADGVRLDVTNTYLNVRSAERRVETATRVEEQAKEAFHIARVRYRAGVGINLDVLDAQLQLDQARINYITALYDYNIGLAELERAMGVPAVIHYTPEEAQKLNEQHLITADDLLGRNDAK